MKIPLYCSRLKNLPKDKRRRFEKWLKKNQKITPLFENLGKDDLQDGYFNHHYEEYEKGTNS